MKTKHTTIMFTDIKGFTSKTSAKTRMQIHEMLELHDELVKPVFKDFGGKIIKTVGDAFLVIFDSPTDAVLCGMKIQDKLAGHNKEADEKIEVRVAINSGEVQLKDGDIFGEPVNIAARIEGIAEANDIYFTEAVYLAMNKSEIPSAEVGMRHLKGIPHQIKVYKVLKEKEGMPTFKTGRISSFGSGITGRIKRFYHKRKKILKWIGIILLLLIIIGSCQKKDLNSAKTLIRANKIIESGDYNAAEKILRQYENIRPEERSASLEVVAARLYHFTEDYPKMFNSLRLAMASNPDDYLWPDIVNEALFGYELFEPGGEKVNMLNEWIDKAYEKEEPRRIILNRIRMGLESDNENLRINSKNFIERHNLDKEGFVVKG